MVRSLVIVLVIVGLVPIVAWADARIPIPRGFTEARPGSPAMTRAEAWAQGDVRVEQVFTPTTRHELAETLAVLHVPRPLDPDVLRDPRAAERRLAEAGRELIGADTAPEAVELVAVPGDTTALVGRWEDDAVVMRVALVPEGMTHTAIVLAVSRRMDVLYAEILDDALANVDGAVAPVRSFPRGRWIAVACGGWLVVLVAGGLLVARAVGGTPGPVDVARRVATGISLLAVVVVVGAAIATSDADAELTAAGVSAMWLVVQVGAGGFVAAAALVLGAWIWERRTTPIASAPTQGTYAPWTRSPSGPRPAVSSIPASPAAPPTVGSPPTSAAPVPDVGFPAPGRPSELGELRLAPSDEPAAHLEHVGAPQDDPDDELANLATAEIRLDAPKGPPGGRFRR